MAVKLLTESETTDLLTLARFYGHMNHIPVQVLRFRGAATRLQLPGEVQGSGPLRSLAKKSLEGTSIRFVQSIEFVSIDGAKAAKYAFGCNISWQT